MANLAAWFRPHPRWLALFAILPILAIAEVVAVERATATAAIAVVAPASAAAAAVEPATVAPDTAVAAPPRDRAAHGPRLHACDRQRGRAPPAG